MELRVSCRFIDNLQPTYSNVKLLQCYDIFLTSLNLTCTKVKNSTQPCDDPAHQRTLQETPHTPSARWGRDPGINSPYAKTQECSIFSTPTQICSERPSNKNRTRQGLVHRFVSQINLLGPTWHKSLPKVTWEYTLVLFYFYIVLLLLVSLISFLNNFIFIHSFFFAGLRASMSSIYMAAWKSLYYTKRVYIILATWK